MTDAPSPTTPDEPDSTAITDSTASLVEDIGDETETEEAPSTPSDRPLTTDEATFPDVGETLDDTETGSPDEEEAENTVASGFLIVAVEPGGGRNTP